MLEKIFPKRPQVVRQGRGPLAAVTWDPATIYYVVCDRRGEAIRKQQRGAIARVEDQEPLQALAEHFKAESIDARRLVLLLARADLEMTTFPVPAGVGSDLPAVVALELEDKVGESERELVADYLLPVAYSRGSAGRGSVKGSVFKSTEGAKAGDVGNANESSAGADRVIAYWMFAETRDAWGQRAAAAGFQLEAITPRQLGPLGSVVASELGPQALAAVVVVYHSEIEFAFVRGGEILGLRSIRLSATDVEALAEQVRAEIRRTASMADWGVTGEEFDIVLLRCAGEVAGVGMSELETLSERLPARLIGAGDGERRDPAIDLVLLGAASEHLAGNLTVNLLAPKRPPVPPNPVKRWALIGGLATVALAAAGSMLRSDVKGLEGELALAKSELQQTQSVAAKLQEKADQTRSVRQWLEDQTDWLSQLRLLSQRFPESQVAHLRNLRARVEGGEGQFDLAVQVRSPDAVAMVEERLREAGFDVTSQQVSEQADDPEYPWRFDATLRFRPPLLEDREEQEEFKGPAGADLPSGDAADKKGAGAKDTGEKGPALKGPVLEDPTDKPPAGESKPDVPAAKPEATEVVPSASDSGESGSAGTGPKRTDADGDNQADTGGPAAGGPAAGVRSEGGAGR
jgi:hypothetical protein